MASSQSPPPVGSPGRTPTPNSATRISAPLSNAPGVDPISHAPPPGAPPSNPKVAELQIMFPSVEPSVIEMILESVGGSQDRAIETLLSMTDPEFKPDERHVRTEAESQMDLDAQFARSLQIQDEQEAERRGTQLPYQPRVRRNRPQGGDDHFGRDDRDYGQQYGQNAQNAQNPPGMLAMEDKINQFAEVGKQTFNSFFNKAKAKYAEFQTQHAAQSSAADRARESGWGQTGNEPWRNPSPQGTPTPGGNRGGEQNRRGWDDASSFSSQSTDPGPTPISPHTASNPPLRQPAARWQPSDAYDEPTPPVGVASQSRIEVGGRQSPAIGSPDKGIGSAGKIDPAKLGILPKKKVDLMSTSPPGPATPTNRSLIDNEEDDPNPTLPSAHKSLVQQIPKTPPARKENPYSLGDSDDDLEYTKNPFDEK